MVLGVCRRLLAAIRDDAEDAFQATDSAYWRRGAIGAADGVGRGLAIPGGVQYRS